MKYSVDLEAPFAFSAYWYAAGILLIIFGRLLFLFFRRILRMDPEPPLKVDRTYKSCMKRIAEIERRYRSGELDTRAAHGQMSAEVRGFVQEMTGLQAQTMVYDELRKRGRPELAALIGEYYGPEFSYTSEADTEQAIEKGRALVAEEYKRSVKTRKVRAAAIFRSVINEELGSLMRKLPSFLTPALTDRVRSNTRKWIMRIEKALSSGELDAFGVHKQMSAAVKSFLHIVKVSEGIFNQRHKLVSRNASGGRHTVEIDKMVVKTSAVILYACSESGRKSICIGYKRGKTPVVILGKIL